MKMQKIQPAAATSLACFMRMRPNLSGKSRVVRVMRVRDTMSLKDMNETDSKEERTEEQDG